MTLSSSSSSSSSGSCYDCSGSESVADQVNGWLSSRHVIGWGDVMCSSWNWLDLLPAESMLVPTNLLLLLLLLLLLPSCVGHS